MCEPPLSTSSTRTMSYRKVGTDGGVPLRMGADQRTDVQAQRPVQPHSGESLFRRAIAPVIARPSSSFAIKPTTAQHPELMQRRTSDATTLAEAFSSNATPRLTGAELGFAPPLTTTTVPHYFERKVHLPEDPLPSGQARRSVDKRGRRDAVAEKPEPALPDELLAALAKEPPQAAGTSSTAQLPAM